MTHPNIYGGDPFTSVALTSKIEKMPHKPMKISSMGIFQEKGINTTVASVERRDGKLALVEAQERGGDTTVVTATKRKTIPFAIPHLPQTASVYAHEIQDQRQFGEEDSLETVESAINDRLKTMKNNLDATIEYHRVNAIQGKILDADGTTVLVDIHDAFGFNRSSATLALDDQGTKVKSIVEDEVNGTIEEALGSAMYERLVCMCSPQYYKALTSHDSVIKAFERKKEGEFLRNDYRYTGFEFAGVYWFQYRGSVNNTPFIPENKAFVFPIGVDGMFETYYAPGDYMQTVNKIGRPYYVSAEPKKHGKGQDLEAQSNPLNLCLMPEAVVELEHTP